MKIKFFLVLLITTEITLYTFAQVNTAWIRRFDGPANAIDIAKVIKIDDNGSVYVGGQISRTTGHPDLGVIKYNSNGDTLWVRYYNSPGNEGGEYFDLTLDKFGNVIITGSSIGTNSTSDYATIKYDANGNELWVRRYDDGDSDTPIALAVDDLGNIYVTGTSWRVNQNYNIVTIKYNNDGDSLWTYSYNGFDNSGDFAKDIALDSQGNVFITGTEDYYWSPTGTDYIIIKCNPSGDTLWTAKYDGTGTGFYDDDYVRAIAVDNSGNVYVTGESFNENNYLDIVTIKYNSYGDSIWVKRYRGAATGDEKVTDIAVDSSGNVFVTGSIVVNNSGADYVTIKYNASGDEQWIKTYAGYSSYPDLASSVVLDKFGNIYVTGTSSSSSSNVDFATIKYDKDGNEKWVIKYNGPGNSYDDGNGICVDDSGNVYVTGTSAGIGTQGDFVTIMYNQTLTGIGEDFTDLPCSFNLEQNYPNPFNPSTIINWQSPVGSYQTIKLFDVLGREIEIIVDGYYEAGNHSTLYIPNSTLPAGVYFYQLRAGSFVEIKKMILLR
uniref:T9SS type A sorting domain-containing protein n=1 Tax=Ignavibacterium album TaxID=591197 RepID=A0A832LJZ3_9BACT